jgi:hypothetical protein
MLPSNNWSTLPFSNQEHNFLAPVLTTSNFGSGDANGIGRRTVVRYRKTCSTRLKQLYSCGNEMNLYVHSELMPPRTWEQFEELCADVFAADWSDPALVRYGRAGQTQHGVDIVARRGSTWPVGLQCKRKARWPVKRLTREEVNHEVAGALKFRPKLKSFWILTTAPDDAPVQEHARLINERHSKKGLFYVHILGWSEICRRAMLHSTVADKHFGPDGSGARAPLLAVWFASKGRLELKGRGLALSCRELGHDLRDHPEGRLVLRQRESDVLAGELASYDRRMLSLEEREARLAVRDKLARNEHNESRISRGLKLLLGDPTIAVYLLGVYRDSGDAPRAVASFIQHELDPQKGLIQPGTTRLRVRAPGYPDIWQSSYISRDQVAAFMRLAQSRVQRFGRDGYPQIVAELPDEVRASAAFPAVISALLRELDEGRSLEDLRKLRVLEIASWRAELG